jgi:hypothetical protein
MVHVAAPRSQQWQWSIGSTVTPKLVSQLRRNRCHDSVARRLQLASHCYRNKALYSLVFLESSKDMTTIRPKLATDNVTQYGTTTARLRPTFPTIPNLSHRTCLAKKLQQTSMWICHNLATDIKHRFLQSRDTSLCSHKTWLAKKLQQTPTWTCHVLATDTKHRFLQSRDTSLCSIVVHVLKYR